MALNSREMWSNGILNSFFFQKLTKIAQTPIATGSWGLRPQTPVCDTFEYTRLLNSSPKLDIYTFYY